ncbi:hybrid sensor histidine kinase/response regulator [candidate division KSB1 bacterium]|nr:hybrid sensor histidine kinase/response regulator [candidate division KSB1 bacterium]
MEHSQTLHIQRLLVVDDEEIVRKSCAAVLRRAGYQVDTEENGVKALQALAKGSYDIVLVDLKMPLMNGLELLKTIRRDFPHVQVIIMTGYATVENAIFAMKEGAYDFVLKPFKADQLQMIVNRCAKTLDLNSEIKELKLANQKLKELQEMKDKFIAITSHELRTPVSHIKGYLSILNDTSYVDITPEERGDFMNIIQTAISDLENIVHNMFDILQFESGHFQLHPEPFVLDTLIGQVVHEYNYILKQRNIHLNNNELHASREIYADRTKIKQVVVELLQNAIRFTPDGGQISIRTAQRRQLCELKISDTGVGIHEENIGKIFEKFYEVQNTDYHSSSKTKFMGGGIGLGLSIVKAIVEAHQGRISVTSEPGNGSEFTMVLPMTMDVTYDQGRDT